MKMIDEVGISHKLRHICPNHEQALAMMVDTYSRLKGFGVGMVTSGPGAVNLATGIACSYYDSIPNIYFMLIRKAYDTGFSIRIGQTKLTILF